MLLSVLLALAAAPGHPDSLSSSIVRVRGHQAHLSLRCQVLSLLEVIDDLDADGDGGVDDDELDARADLVLDYVAAHYRLVVGTDRELQGGTQLAARPVSVRRVPGVSDQLAGYRKGAVDVELAFSAAEPIRDLMLEVTLFHATSPAHIDLASIEWEGGSERFSIDARQPRVRSDPTGRGAFGAFVRLGWTHILSGWDHLAFLLALVLASRRLGALLWVVTSFTLAHSVTLALAALHVVDVSRHAGFIEATIALSIAYVAAETVIQPGQKRARWPEAFVFGLVHGLGFAGFLSQSLVREPSRAWALFSFNLGVELGQVLVVLLLAVALRLLPRRPGEDTSFLAPPGLRRWGSLPIALLGLYWFWERV